MKSFRLCVALAIAAIFVSVADARAADFTITKDPAAGTFSFTDTNPNAPVFEVVVAGFGTTAGTTQPGFSASPFVFNDPLNCLPVLGSTITSGFCYKLTDLSAGQPITGGTTVFTYDAQFDDTSPSDFAIAYDLADGTVGACFGNTGAGGGCNAAAAVPEPASLSVLLAGLLVLACLKRSRTRHASAGLALLVSASLSSPAAARLTRIVVDTTTSVAIGGVNYTQKVGRIFGELDPADPHNAVIQDITLAPLDANQRVPYAATITILTPQTGATGVMLYQVSNRGGQGLPNASTIEPGATYVWTGWQGDLLARNCITDYPCNDLYAGAYQPTGGNPVHVLQVPVAHNPDGSTITGPVYGSVINTTGSTAQLIIYTNPVPYRPATLDTAQAVLTSVTHQTIDGQETGRVVIPSDQWAWADCRTTPFPGTPDPTRLCLKNGFSSSLLYQIVFTARDPLVLGIGFAATRDAVSFLRDAGTDDVGNANPLVGQISKTIAMGTSQSGNFLRSMTYFGFNQTETNGQVFDAIWPHIAGRQIWMNTRFALPDVIQMLYMAADEAPVWWADYADTVRGRAPDGLLHSCTATGTCPKVIETYGAVEFWDLKASPDHVGATAAVDIPLPPTVYSYYFPGTTHGGGSASAFGGSGAANPPATVFPTTLPGTPFNCALPSNPNPEADQFNATLDNIVNWVVNGVAPPRQRLPAPLARPTRRRHAGSHEFPDHPGLPASGQPGQPGARL